ncbi:hypothetical protein DACRYDRAFT_21149 [Dacryopinax primogenitus]|uniref:Uncharacterized protein n=1 Tax=Dacryopinax primogenitus (strain DJM 731) TaxID=1858805 RepID=M5GC12_DACPD|nr:uncharacterized protein DACRYDRAFT_21149 [Dacryopinax primogenitus]EJU03622.1 hypothetical protein DACRYDRAFT_21149 [Dacryopinax primogenitus]
MPAEATPAPKKKSHKAPLIFYSERTTRSSSRMNNSPDAATGADKKRKRDEEEQELDAVGEETAPSSKKQKKGDASPAEPGPPQVEAPSPSLAVDNSVDEADSGKRRKRVEEADLALLETAPADERPVAPLSSRQKKTSPAVLDEIAASHSTATSELAPVAAAAGLPGTEVSKLTA